MRTSSEFFPLLLLLVFAIDSSAQDQIPYQTYLCYKTSTPIVIDGKLGDTAWQEVEWSNKFIDIEGDKKPTPRFETRVKMRWDDSCFYIAAQLQETCVWATLTEHDAVIFHDNDFEVFMDPDGDNWEYGELELNALNTTWDLFLPKPYRDDGHADNSWEITGLKTAVAIQGSLNQSSDTDNGWTVEIAMPWKGLDKIAHTENAPNEGLQWHINFSRVEWLTDIVDGKYKKVEGKAEDNWVWSPQGAINMHMPEKWGIVQFSALPVGYDKFKLPEYDDIHSFMHTVYYAEKAYYEQNKAWTNRIDLLMRSYPELQKCTKNLRSLHADEHGFRAEYDERLRAGLGVATIDNESHFRFGYSFDYQDKMYENR